MAEPQEKHDEVYEKWLSWLEHIKDAVIELHHNRQIWKELTEAIWEHAGDTPYDTFIAHYTRLYVDGQTMAIRRLVKEHSQSSEISLRRLVKDMIHQPTVMSRTRYVGLYTARVELEDHWVKKAEEDFANNFGTGEWLDLLRLEKDLVTLDNDFELVTRFADRTVAHIDKRGVEQLPTFGDLNKAIDDAAEMFRRYALLLTASDWVMLAPAIQENWRAPFQRNLFPKPT